MSCPTSLRLNCGGDTPPGLVCRRGTFSISQGALTLAGGTASLVLRAPVDPVPTHVVEHARDTVYAILMGALVAYRRPCRLNESVTAHQVSDTGVSSTIVAGTGALVATGVAVIATVEVHDKFGVVIGNSEQLKRQAVRDSMLAIYPKIQRSATLRTLLQSYERSIEDVDNEFIHLYEIKDAQRTLWQPCSGRVGFPWGRNSLRTLGKFANFLPLAQGRHRTRIARGKLRPATVGELEDIRGAALRVNSWVCNNGCLIARAVTPSREIADRCSRDGGLPSRCGARIRWPNREPFLVEFLSRLLHELPTAAGK